MSLLEELESRGVTAEDLEKAASVRLFEKAAAAEDVDLESLDQETVEQLYTTFVSNISSPDETTTKEATAMNEEIVELFEKQAAAEGIDLDTMEDTELSTLYTHFVDNVLPEQVEEYEKSAEVEEAHAKLAEAEILGRHMARSYMDEFEKGALDPLGSHYGGGASKPKMTDARRALLVAKRDAATVARDTAPASGRATAANRGPASVKALEDARPRASGSLRGATRNRLLAAKIQASEYGKQGKEHAQRAWSLAKANPKTTAGLLGAAALTTGAAGLAGRKTASADDIEVMAYDLALEMTKESESDEDLDNYVVDRAVEILAEAGYEFV